MLATLLPGIREIRTPLAVGYAWLIALWFAVGHRAPVPHSAHGVLADAYRLANAAGPVAVGVAVSVGAYILGVIATQLGLGTTYAVGHALRRTPAAAATPGHRREGRLKDAFTELVVGRLAERFSTDEAFRGEVLDRLMIDPPEEPVMTRAEWEHAALTKTWIRYTVIGHIAHVEELADELRADLFNIVMRLRGAEDGVALEHDRLQAESDFRIAMFAPLAALCLVLAVRWSPLFALALPVLITLLYVGVATRAEAEERLAWALLAGNASDPAVARLEAVSVPFRPGTGAPAESGGGDLDPPDPAIGMTG